MANHAEGSDLRTVFADKILVLAVVLAVPTEAIPKPNVETPNSRMHLCNVHAPTEVTVAVTKPNPKRNVATPMHL